MENELFKYLAFIIGMTVSLGLLKLWLKSNKLKREKKEKDDEQLEIQKEKYKESLRKKDENICSITKGIMK